VRFKELKDKEVINVATGKCVGFVSDIDIDPVTGCVKALFIPGPGKIGGLFGRDTCYCISWNCVVRIGPDIILINVCELKADGCEEHR